MLDFALLLLMFGAFYMNRQSPEKNPRRILEILVLLIASIQLMLNYLISTENVLKEAGWVHDASEFSETVEQIYPLVEGMKEGDKGLFRMEINKQRSGNCGNDPMLYGYNGVGHGGSVERNFVRTGLNKLGVHWFDMRNYYQEGIPAATDMLLGLKYIIAQEDLTEEKGYQNGTNFDQEEFFQGQENYDIYYNADALPPAFLSEVGIEGVETDFADVFDNLNRTWAAISGENRPVFVEEEEIHFETYNLADTMELASNDARALIEKRDAEDQAAKEDPVSASKADQKKALDPRERPEYSSYIKFTWTASRDGAVYIYDRASMNEAQGAITPILKYAGTYQKGEAVIGYIPAAGDYINHIGFEEICGRFRAAYADNEALHELATIVKNRPCTIEKVKDSHLRGEFTAEAGQKLMFTIPYDEGWTCFIDGKEAEIKQVLGVFMAVDAPEGTHTYEMKFFPVGMKIGIGLSAVALLTTVVYIPVDSRRRKNKITAPITSDV